MSTVPFIGAARFQGHWNATTNAATGSGFTYGARTAASGDFSTLLVNGGYHSSSNLTASNGDYWQVTGSGTTTINGVSAWALNDFVIYSGSTWVKVPVQDMVASIIVGDMSTTTFEMGTVAVTSDLQVSGTAESMGGISNSSTISRDLTYRAATNTLLYGPITISATKTVTIQDGAAVKIKDFSDV